MFRPFERYYRIHDPQNEKRQGKAAQNGVRNHQGIIKGSIHWNSRPTNIWTWTGATTRSREVSQQGKQAGKECVTSKNHEQSNTGNDQGSVQCLGQSPFLFQS